MAKILWANRIHGVVIFEQPWVESLRLNAVTYGTALTSSGPLMTDPDGKQWYFVTVEGKTPGWVHAADVQGQGYEKPPPPGPPAPTPPGALLYVWPTMELNFRDRPYVAPETLIGRLAPTTRLKIVGDVFAAPNQIDVQGQWFNVQVEPAGPTGWVAAWLVRSQETLPPVEVPYVLYGQRNPAWKDIPLGYTTEQTIGSAGCVLCCCAMLSSMRGKVVTPLELNQWLINNDGYYTGNLMIWGKMTEFNPAMTFDPTPADWVDVPADLDVLAQEVAKGPFPLLVDFRPDNAVFDQHWVVAYEWANSAHTDLFILDPWYEEKAALLSSRYAKPGWDLARTILGLRKLH